MSSDRLTGCCCKPSLLWFLWFLWWLFPLISSVAALIIVNHFHAIVYEVLDLRGFLFAFKHILLPCCVIKCALESFEGWTVLGEKKHKLLVKSIGSYKFLLGLSDFFQSSWEREAPRHLTVFIFWCSVYLIPGPRVWQGLGGSHLINFFISKKNIILLNHCGCFFKMKTTPFAGGNEIEVLCHSCWILSQGIT